MNRAIQFCLFLLLVLTFNGAAQADQLSIKVFSDPTRKENFQTIFHKLDTKSVTGQNYADGDTIALSPRGTPYWIIFDLHKDQPPQSSILSFGASNQGRLSFASNVILFNRTTNKTIYNSANQITPIPNDIRIEPAAQPYQQIIAYIEPVGAGALLIKPESKINSFKNFSGGHSLGSILLLISAVLFMGAYGDARAAGTCFLSALSLAVFTHNGLLDHYLFAPEWMALYMPALTFILVGIFLLNAVLRSANRLMDLPSSIAIGSTVMALIISLSGLFIGAGRTPLSQILIYAPALIIALTGIFISFLGVKSRHLHFVGLLIISGLIAVYSSVSILSGFRSMDGSLITGLNGIVLPYALTICSVAYFLNFLLSKSQPQTSASKPSTSSSSSDAHDEQWLEVARSNSEQKRLLQVLEQERAVMTTLQESESRRVEEMRIAKEAADEANRAKSAFLAVVSHEIRTPMTGIMGMVRLMLDTQLTKDQREFANTIQDSGEALLSLLNDILDFEKIESGKMEFEKVDFDVHRLLKGIHTLMNGHASAKNLSLRLDFDETLPEMVIGDPTRIRQVVLNLVNNAIKFTSKGSVTIQVRDLSPNKNDTTVQLYVGVQDQGIGISPEAQRKIFMPFAQADSSTSRKYGGTGLGLAICKRLIESMGGQIGINSREGEGSTFFFTLSLDKSSADAPIIKSSNNRSGAISTPTNVAVPPIRILVVDDNGINQKVLNGLLSKGQHKIFLASDSFEAMDIVSKESLDLILMDMQLPGKNGLEITEDIRNLSDQTIASTPIVAMTGNTGDDDIKACFSSGMNDYLSKPISPELLQSVIVKTVSGQYGRMPQKNNSDRETTSPTPAQTSSQNEHNVMAHGLSLDEDDDDQIDEFEKAVRDIESQNVQDQNDRPIDFKSSGLNEDIIGSLYNTLGQDQTRDLLKSFYETADTILDALMALKSSDNFDAINARAHELKGMAANFGFEQLAHIAGDIEFAAKEKDPSRIEYGTDQLMSSYTTSREAINNWIG